MKLDLERCRSSIVALARHAGLSPTRLAEGVLEVAEETMAAALRVVSVQRGYDPREFTLLPFGGAGGLHACALAEKLGIGKILLPIHPGLLSAVGMVLAEVIRDYSRSVLWSGEVAAEVIDTAFAPLIEQAQAEMFNEGVDPQALRLERSLDLRYQGQSFEINIPAEDNFDALFHQRHLNLYGYSDPDRALEIVTLRLRAIGPGAKVELRQQTAQTRSEPVNRPICFDDKMIDCPVYEREALGAADVIDGPALIVEETATHLLKPGWRLTLDKLGNLLMEYQSGGGVKR